MCGAPNEEDSIFCGNCGAVLKPEQAPPQVEAEARPEVEEEPVEFPALDSPPAMSPVLVPPSAQSWSPAVAPTVPISGLAIASLILGIGGLTVLPLLGSIVAIILGIMARNDIRQRPHEVSGDGIALAGIVLGWIAVGLAVLSFVVFGALGACSLCGAFSSGGFD